MSHKFPPKVKIGHAVYTVREEPGLGQVTETTGTCGQDVQTILVDPVIGPDMMKETVLHEILHGVVFGAALKPLLEDIEKDAGVKELEEKVINHISGLLLQVLQDNPKLVTWLTQA